MGIILITVTVGIIVGNLFESNEFPADVATACMHSPS